MLNPTQIKRAFVYARVSTKQQLEGDGFSRQILACETFAAKNDWVITRTFQEQQTGSDEFGERQKLSEAMDLSGLASPTGVTAIIIERADRIARDLIVSELFFRECRVRKILVYAADSGEELVNAAADPTRILIRQILGALAEWEKQMLIRKLQSARRRKSDETGLPCGGPVPFADLDAIALIFQMRDSLRLSFQECANRLTARGVATPQGDSAIWGKSTVYHLYNRHKKDETYARAVEFDLVPIPAAFL